jgi:hypothetical protein
MRMAQTTLPDDIAKEEGRFRWKKYCGFLDLSLEEFRSVQEALLQEQLLLLRSNQLLKRLRIETRISSTAELRSLVPLTTYRDYEQLLSDKDESLLPEKLAFWAYTTTSSGRSKWVPFTLRAYGTLIRSVIAAAILACAEEKGDVNVSTSDRILYTVAPAPFLTGHIARGLEQFGFRGLPPEIHDKLGFHAAVAESVRRALHDGCSIMISPATVANTVAQRISAMSGGGGGGVRKLSDPKVVFRVAKARFVSWMERRPILPRDLWNLKGLIGWGIDMSILRESIARNWGVAPYEFMASTEGGILGLQAWSKKSMTFVPTSVFFEFLPEGNVPRVDGDVQAKDGTVLLDGLRAGERYEVVITSFYGMPFVRYRTGLMVRVKALEDREAGIKLPQVELVGRSDGLIDLAGFTRLDERTVLDALAACGLDTDHWMARRENRGNEPILALYVELPDDANLQEIRDSIHASLRKLDADYKDVEELLGIRSLELRQLTVGTFEAYRQAAAGTGIEKDMAGYVPKTNASQEVADRLVELSRRIPGGKAGDRRFLV